MEKAEKEARKSAKRQKKWLKKENEKNERQAWTEMLLRMQQKGEDEGGIQHPTTSEATAAASVAKKPRDTARMSVEGWDPYAVRDVMCAEEAMLARKRTERSFLMAARQAEEDAEDRLRSHSRLRAMFGQGNYW